MRHPNFIPDCLFPTDHAIKHAQNKGAEIALVYDRFGEMHREDVENGMRKYKDFNPNPPIKAVLVMDKNKNLYEHHFD